MRYQLRYFPYIKLGAVNSSEYRIRTDVAKLKVWSLDRLTNSTNVAVPRLNGAMSYALMILVS